jgi:hypothetical protein
MGGNMNSAAKIMFMNAVLITAEHSLATGEEQRLHAGTGTIVRAVACGRITPQVGSRIYTDLMCDRIQDVESAIVSVSDSPAISQGITGREPMLGGDKRK